MQRKKSKGFNIIYDKKNFIKESMIQLIKHRGEAALRINCDTFDTFRTKECKETIETAKIIKTQQKRKISVKFARFNI